MNTRAEFLRAAYAERRQRTRDPMDGWRTVALCAVIFIALAAAYFSAGWVVP